MKLSKNFNIDNNLKKTIINEKSKILKHKLRLVAWETTKSCNLSCLHCRASADNKKNSKELSTIEAFELMENISNIGKPIVILTGGEPLLREDIFEIASYGNKLGLKIVMAPNGTLINREIAKKIVNSGIKRVSISIDGSNEKLHDSFRGVNGAYNAALRGIEYIKAEGIEFQINTTITSVNLKDISKILKFAENSGAVAHHIFLLVPTGRGKYINETLNAKDYENVLHWFYDQKNKSSIKLKATCAPHYYRIMRQRNLLDGKIVSFKTHGLDAVTRGCLGGIGFCFISNIGVVQPCGYTNVFCGDIRNNLFSDIWNNSVVLKRLRDLTKLKGKCGRCEYSRVCGGCRARGYESYGDYMEEEPLCSFEPSL